MKSDLQAVINKVVKFLGKTIKNDRMKELLLHLDIKTMRKNKVQKINGIKYDGTFIKKGQVGSFDKAANPELKEKMDKWIVEHFDGKGLFAQE